MKASLIHKIGINCSKQRRKETTIDSEVTCPACLDQLHYKNRFSEENFKGRVYIPDIGFPLLPLPDGILDYETPGYTKIMLPLEVEIGEGVDLTEPREYKDILKFPLP